MKDIKTILWRSFLQKFEVSVLCVQRVLVLIIDQKSIQ